MRKSEPNVERSTESTSQAREVLPHLERVVEEMESFQEALGSRNPRLEIEIDLEGLALPDACLEALERMRGKIRDPEACALAEEAVIQLDECLSGLSQLDLQIEIEQEDPAGPVFFSELLVGFQKTLNTVRALAE